MISLFSPDIPDDKPSPYSYGLDEAGRGCLAGPVVAAVVLFSPATDWSALDGLNDSKKLTAKKRNHLAPRIKQEAAAYGIGLSWQLEIDEINIVNATFRAMCRAIIAMRRNIFPLPKAPVYIDGNLLIREDAWKSCAHIPPSRWHVPYFPAFPMPEPATDTTVQSPSAPASGGARAVSDTRPAAGASTDSPSTGPSAPCSSPPSVFSTDSASPGSSLPGSSSTGSFLPGSSSTGISSIGSSSTGISSTSAISNGAFPTKTFGKASSARESLPQTDSRVTQEELDEFPFPHQKAIVGGDGLIPGIAAASILAKTTRDSIMERFDARFPHYGFAKHKGYGTREHQEAVRQYGPCVLHRRTFIQNILGRQEQLLLFQED